MSKVEIHEYTCDGCGLTETFRTFERLQSWGEIAMREGNGLFKIGGGHGAGGQAIKHADICPICVKSLKEWWAGLKGAKKND